MNIFHFLCQKFKTTYCLVNLVLFSSAGFAIGIPSQKLSVCVSVLTRVASER